MNSDMENNERNPDGKGFASYSGRGVQVRLFLTCWLIYFLHFSPFVTRELYLALSVAEQHTMNVDTYVGLHPDLFYLEGRGAFIAANPGISFLAAVPYALALPVVNKIAPIRIPKDEKIAADTKDPRYMRQQFYKKTRAMGIEVRLGIAAMLTAGLFMAPLAAASAVVMYRLFRWMGMAARLAAWLALLYAFGTPVFFRAATLSPNLLVALLMFFAFALLWWPSGKQPEREKWRYVLAGFLGGYLVLTDYSGAVPAAALGLFAFAQQMQKKKFWPALRDSLWYLAGAAAPLGVLLWYQWSSFGSPWWPVQYYMPKKYLQNYPSEVGFGKPLPSALWGLLFDPLYGLLVFSPIFAVALYHFALMRRRLNRVPASVAVFTWSFSIAFWVFCSMVHYTIRHQWQDGVRYIVPVVPLLFLLIGDVLSRAPRLVAYVIGIVAVAEMWCLAMVRESPLESVARAMFIGFELPSLTALSKVAAQYYPPLENGGSPVGMMIVCGILVWAIWKVEEPWKAMEEEKPQ